MSVENFSGEPNREKAMLKAKTLHLVYEGLRAYGLEQDKLPKFTVQIRNTVEGFLRFPQRNVSIDESFQRELVQLWHEAAARNPKKEGEAKRAEILRFISQQLPVDIPESEQEKLRGLIIEIIDSEDSRQRG